MKEQKNTKIFYSDKIEYYCSVLNRRLIEILLRQERLYVNETEIMVSVSQTGCRHTCVSPKFSSGSQNKVLLTLIIQSDVY
jgi:hypothetical protein